jgi:putative oxidoreductase
MIGFIAVQTWVDLVGHGVTGAAVGAWFDPSPSGDIADQRAFWVFLLLVLTLRGAGPLSLDALATRYKTKPRTSKPQPR